MQTHHENEKKYIIAHAVNSHCAAHDGRSAGGALYGEI